MGSKRGQDELESGPALGDLVALPDEHLARHRRPERPSTSNMPLIIGGILAGLLALGGAAFWLTRNEPEKAEAVIAPPPAKSEIAKVPAPPPPAVAPPPVAPPPAPPPKVVEPAPVEAKATAALPPPPPPRPKKKVVRRRKKKTDVRTEKAMDSALDRLLKNDDE